MRYDWHDLTHIRSYYTYAYRIAIIRGIVSACQEDKWILS